MATAQSKESDDHEKQPAGKRRSRFLKKKWHKIVFFTFLFLVVAMLVDSGISRMYSYWDVGSNSWFDRFKGDGWQFQRGAATIDHDAGLCGMPGSDANGNIIFGGIGGVAQGFASSLQSLAVRGIVAAAF